MTSSYKKLGPYIRQVDVRNTEGREDNLLGVSTQKIFIKSVSNTVGTDFSRYKVVRRGQFTYVPDTSRRGDKIGLAMLDHIDEAIVSQAYTVFEVINHEELLPEYLMMWFRRPEFDRYARYMSHGSVREIFGWEEMCGVELPIPDIDVQREIVREYNVIVDRIKLNEKLCNKLEETAQALYKHWFVDFEFPISAEYAASIGKPELEGKPYKSSNGTLQECDKLEIDIPSNWKTCELDDFCKLVTKGTTPKIMKDRPFDGSVNYFKAESISDFHSINLEKVSFIDQITHDKELKRSILKNNDILFSIAGTLGKFALVQKAHLPANTNQALAIIRINPEKISFYYILGMFLSDWHTEFYKRNARVAVQANLNLATIKSLPVLKPDDACLAYCLKTVTPIIRHLSNILEQNEALKKSANLQLQRLAA